MINWQRNGCQDLGPVVINDSYLVDFLRQYEKIGKKIHEDKDFRATSLFKNWNAINEIGVGHDWYGYPNAMENNILRRRQRRNV